MHSFSKRSWTTVDLNILKQNLAIYKNSVAKSSSIIAVLKADAYGHGDQVLAKYLFGQGVHHFAVSNIDEGIRIREICKNCQIIILGYTPFDRAYDILKYDLTQALLSEEYAEKLAEYNLPFKSQFAIDTGMRRIGLNADDPAFCEHVIRKYADKFLLTGLFTHLCVADTPAYNPFTELQINKFENIVSRVADLNLPFCHCMNSAGGLWHHSKYSFIRLGIVLYGLKPDYSNTLPDGIQPVLSWKSVISMIKDVYPGDTVGYGNTYVSKELISVATVTTGYADGYPRCLSNIGFVLVNGHKAPIIGRICMDQMMVNVTGIPNVHMGSEVVLIGKSGNETITADDLAYSAETIGYEILCGISKRVDRYYVSENLLDNNQNI